MILKLTEDHLFLKLCHSVRPSYWLGKYIHFYTISHPSILLGSLRKWVEIIWRLLKSKCFLKGRGWYFIINVLYLGRNMFRCKLVISRWNSKFVWTSGPWIIILLLTCLMHGHLLHLKYFWTSNEIMFLKTLKLSTCKYLYKNCSCPKNVNIFSTFPIGTPYCCVHSFLICIHFILVSTCAYFTIVFSPTTFRQRFSSQFIPFHCFCFLAINFNQIFVICWKSSWKHIYNWGNVLLITIFLVSKYSPHPSWTSF